MTALREAIDYTTLGWVKPELDETLRQARIEIEGFAEDPGDSSQKNGVGDTLACGMWHADKVIRPL